jgi:hypothetical protein
MSATASLGTVLLWDVEGGLPQASRPAAPLLLPRGAARGCGCQHRLSSVCCAAAPAADVHPPGCPASSSLRAASPAPQIDRFLYSTDSQVVAGALLAVGIVSCGVQDEVDPALALLSGAWLAQRRRLQGLGLDGWALRGLWPRIATPDIHQPAAIACPASMQDRGRAVAGHVRCQQRPRCSPTTPPPPPPAVQTTCPRRTRRHASARCWGWASRTRGGRRRRWRSCCCR